MAEKKVQLSKKDRLSVALRSTFLQGSWNYERMQNGGWCFAMIPAIKKLYTTKEDQIAALKRHLEFFNTHPYVASPVIGVTLALEEDKANGAPVEDSAIQGVKVGMMGPLAGVGDPVFWFTARPILGALGASLAMGGSILGPILFFVLWNVIRWAFMWYTPRRPKLLMPISSGSPMRSARNTGYGLPLLMAWNRWSFWGMAPCVFPPGHSSWRWSRPRDRSPN